jgi:Concanavalin A-like lectin/glucanases superfamily/Gylcosyl hydrolase family 115 C-terminal domain
MYEKLTKLIFCFVLVPGLAARVAAAEPFQQDPGPDGIVSVEAEDFDENIPRPPHTWERITATASGFVPPGGFSGGYAMQSTPTTPGGGEGFDTAADYLTKSPRLDYNVNFIKTGTYYVWVLAWALDGNSDSIHSGLDGLAIATADRISLSTTYGWTNAAYQDPERIMFDVNSPGIHTLNIWMREDGSVVDKIVLTTNPDYKPTGAGPKESQRGPLVKAYNPAPADGEVVLDTWATLTWSAGQTAVSHDVYFGENSADVNDGTADTFRANQPSPYFVVGFPGYPYPDGLVPGTTYYWRIDEIEADGTKHKGDVWSFMIPPRKAYDPSPPDGARFVTSDATLSWTAGLRAKLHYVYFGTDHDTIADATGGLPQTATTYDPGPLTLDTAYYWRVDEFDGGTVSKGDVWSFKTVPPISITDPNLIGWWKLDESSGTTAIDWSGHGNDGTLNGDPQWTEGYDGGALAFDGGDYVELPTGMAGSDVGSITCWIKTTQTDRGMIFYGSDGTSGNGYGDENELHLNVENGGVAEFYIEGGDNDAAVETTNVSDDSWQHIAATWDINGQVTIYLNGGSPVSAKHTGFNFQMTGRIRLGAPNASERYYVGLLDDVRLYNKVLTPDEITQVMRGDPLLAWNAKPANGSVVNYKDATPLTWSPGDKASEHDVYFGTDKDAVTKADATDATGIYRGHQNGTSYSPSDVEWGGGPYYWRIDEVNTDGTINTGRLWSFTVRDYILVDDFESYDAADNQIWYAWQDGLGYGVPGTPPYFAGNGTGSAVGDETTGSFTEETIVHGGSQSMPFVYDNNKQGFAKYSEAELTLSYPRDWTEGGVDELSLWFQGRPGSVGSFVEAPVGTYTMTAAGTDIWNQADQFHFAYKMLTGVGSIQAKVLSVDNTDAWAKAGVMIRETLDAGSKFAAIYITPGNGCRFQARTDTDIAATSDTAVASTQQMAIAAPYWVKLERDVAGNFRGYYSADGTTWTPMTWNPQSIVMGSNIYVGLALTAHSANATCTAKFSNIQTTGTVGPQWADQDIGIVSNAAEPLYVALSNAGGQPAVVVHPDSAAAQTTTWTEWVIPLSAFSDQGINLTNVDQLAIGLGTRGNMTAPGGSGKMYFDDIRLYRSKTSP